MTPLPHNPAITVIDLPEDATNMKVRFGRYITVDRPFSIRIIGLGPGTYKLICLGLQATEEEAREIVEKYGRLYMCYTDSWYVYFEAKESLRSLITSNGWKNPVFLRKEK